MNAIIYVFKAHGKKFYIILEILVFIYSLITQNLINQDISGSVVISLILGVLATSLRICFWTYIMKSYDEGDFQNEKVFIFLIINILLAYLNDSFGLSKELILPIIANIVSVIFFVTCTFMYMKKSHLLMVINIFLILIMFIFGVIFFLDLRFLYPILGFKSVLLLLTNLMKPFVTAIPLAYYFINEKR